MNDHKSTDGFFYNNLGTICSITDNPIPFLIIFTIFQVVVDTYKIKIICEGIDYRERLKHMKTIGNTAKSQARKMKHKTKNPNFHSQGQLGLLMSKIMLPSSRRTQAHKRRTFVWTFFTRACSCSFARTWNHLCFQKLLSLIHFFTTLLGPEFTSIQSAFHITQNTSTSVPREG